MSFARDMLEASPAAIPLPVDDVADVIRTCSDAAQACASCADSCLAEQDVEKMRACIGLAQNCTDVCDTVGRVLSRPGSWDHRVVHALLHSCFHACMLCAEECAHHAEHHRHCALCAQACRACEKACEDLLDDEAFEELEKLAGG